MNSKSTSISHSYWHCQVYFVKKKKTNLVALASKRSKAWSSGGPLVIGGTRVDARKPLFLLSMKLLLLALAGVLAQTTLPPPPVPSSSVPPPVPSTSVPPITSSAVPSSSLPIPSSSARPSPSSSSSTPGPTAPSTQTQNDSGSPANLGLILGIVGGCLVAAILGIWAFRKFGTRPSKNFKNRLNELSNAPLPPAPGSHAMQAVPATTGYENYTTEPYQYPTSEAYPVTTGADYGYYAQGYDQGYEQYDPNYYQDYQQQQQQGYQYEQYDQQQYYYPSSSQPSQAPVTRPQ